MASWKESMINRLSNLINRNRSAAKISQVLCSNIHTKNTLFVKLVRCISIILLIRGSCQMTVVKTRIETGIYNNDIIEIYHNMK